MHEAKRELQGGREEEIRREVKRTRDEFERLNREAGHALRPK